MQIDINPEQFAASIAQAVLAALNQANTPAKPTPLEPVTIVKGEFPAEPRKRGRPRKAAVASDTISSAQTLPSEEESTTSILEYSPPPEAITPGRRAIANTVAAKRTVVTGTVAASPRDIITKDRKVRFMDDKSVAKDDPRLYQNLPERVTRDPAVKVKLNCHFCRRDFEIYPGEQPQAFERMKDPVSGSIETALARCENCYGR